MKNVLQVAVEEAYRDTRVYPIDVDRNINISFLKNEGYLNLDVESITNTVFYLDDNNRVQIRDGN